MRPEAIDFDWFFSWSRPNVRLDSGITVVSIDGPLEHKDNGWFDSYEAILERIESAMTGDDVMSQHRRAQNMHRWMHENDAGYVALPDIDQTPARAVVMCIDSPGGEAAGCTEAHRAIRRMRAKYDVPIYAFANELAASAGYEIACAADEIWTTESGVLGSIGVIASAFDRLGQNEKIGLKIELVTSGEEKADGHPDRPLTDPIIARVQKRVDELASIFFGVVARARGTSPKYVQGLQAATFLGQAAVDVGIADGVANFEDFIGIVERTLETSNTTESDITDTSQ
jgi:ClpP class serine protease